MICETEFNRTAFRLRAFAGAKRMAAGRFSPGLDNSMRIATYNVNGINGRLADLLER